MHYTLTMTEEDEWRLRGIIFSCPDKEGAAYVLCGNSNCGGETRLVVREVVPVEAEHYLVREIDRLSIASRSYASVAKRAAGSGASILFVHSHPTGVPYFSTQDDREEPKLMEFFGDRVPHRVHGSLMIPQDGRPVARVWTEDGWCRIRRIRTVGTRFRFVDDATEDGDLPEFFDRQVRAFGPDIQRLLSRLHVGIVGVGGTGSAVFEQLVRLGVGTISVYDGESFELTNVNRVYGSRVADEGRPKVEVAEGNAQRIGLNTTVFMYPSISRREAAMTLRACDVVFGCTDKQAPRGILVRLALYYLIPVIDVGVKVDSEGGVVRGVNGRVTVLLPGEACLFCRQRISAEMIRLESLSPQEWQALADEDYAPELETVAPAVIPFTTAVAAQGVSELLHRLTGFMGAERCSSETLLFFHEPAVRTNRTPAGADCICSQKERWGRGDRRTFVDVVWPD